MPRPADLLLSPQHLHERLQSGHYIAVDCRFDLVDPERGGVAYRSGHIPGAHYAHLDHDLSSPITAGSGRHPLPQLDAFAGFLSRIGWKPDKVLVAYDDRNGAMAVRLWWLMRYFGQDAALLDGGLEAWLRKGFPLEEGTIEVEAAPIPELHVQTAMTVSASEILAQIEKPEITIIDARAPERFTGAIEPIDSRAGHIPGALNRPLGNNLDALGQFKQPGQLRSEFELLLQQRPCSPVVHSCGSGVTACHNYFAMELAGLGASRVYPGSWSEWIRDAGRPIETGPGR